jgi:hypothetical protein
VVGEQLVDFVNIDLQKVLRHFDAQGLGKLRVVDGFEDAPLNIS